MNFESGGSEIERRRVPRLVQHDLPTPGDFEVDRPTEATVFDATRELRSFRRELGDRQLDVIADERDLMVLGSRLGGVDAEFRWTGPEDEPPVVRVDVRPVEHVPEEGSCRVGIIRVDKRMDTGDHLRDSRRTPR